MFSLAGGGFASVLGFELVGIFGVVARLFVAGFL